MGLHELCEICEKYGISEHLMGEEKFVSIEDFPLHDILERQGCPLCKLLHGLIFTSISTANPDNVCQLKAVPGPLAQLDVIYGEISGMKIQVKRIVELDISHDNEKSHSFPSSEMDLDRLRRIFSSCVLDHEFCRYKSLPASFRKKKNILLIDVLNNCLVEASNDMERVALSYVWGQDQTLKTSGQNLTELKEEGALLRRKSEVPKTIWDSILLVRELGQRYLWVDSFCIIQDDEKHKAEQIKQMHDIYGGSILTIVAISGRDANAGLPGVQPNTRPLKSTQLNETFSLVATNHNLHNIMESSLYETRGWTMQERLLSPRCLYISDWQYFFACVTETCCEEEIAKEDFKKFDPHGTAPTSLLRTIAFRNGKIGAELAFAMYSELIEMFSKRSFTNPFDRINGITGINTVIVPDLGGLLCGGYPAQVLAYGLLWIPKSGLDPKDTRNEYFPSWGWAGWKCPVSFELAVEVFMNRKEISQCFSIRPDLEKGSHGQWIDYLDINALAINANHFAPGVGLGGALVNEYPAEIVDHNGKLAGVLLDTEIQGEPLRSSCWFLMLYFAPRAIRNFDLPVSRVVGLRTKFTGSDPLSEQKTTELDRQIIVMLVQEKEDHFERMGIGLMAVNSFKNAGVAKEMDFKLL